MWPLGRKDKPDLHDHHDHHEPHPSHGSHGHHHEPHPPHRPHDRHEDHAPPPPSRGRWGWRRHHESHGQEGSGLLSLLGNLIRSNQQPQHASSMQYAQMGCDPAMFEFMKGQGHPDSIAMLAARDSQMAMGGLGMPGMSPMMDTFAPAPAYQPRYSHHRGSMDFDGCGYDCPPRPPCGPHGLGSRGDLVGTGVNAGMSLIGDALRASNGVQAEPIVQMQSVGDRVWERGKNGEMKEITGSPRAKAYLQDITDNFYDSPENANANPAARFAYNPRGNDGNC